jgi:hypothetical protein
MKENYFFEGKLFPQFHRWRNLLTVLTILLFGQFAYSQASAYIFTQSQEVYIPITGGTVLWSGYDGFDDDISAAIPISFVYQGVPYSSIFVSANGNLKFGASSTSNVPISGGLNAVAAFSVDLDAKSDVSATYPYVGLPEVRYQEIGDEFVVQWSNVTRWGTSGATSAENLNFQIRLNTATGEILIVYGDCVDRVTALTTYPQVGLGGGSTTNFNNRMIAAGGGDWINSEAGTANNSTMAFNGSTIPTSGLTFSFFPPECSAPAGITVVPSGYSANISWNAIPNADEYEWVVVANDAGVNATPIASGTTSNAFAVATGLNVTTPYDLFVQTICGADGVSVWSSKIDFTTTVACPAPTAATSTGITAYAATLGWTSPGNTFEVNWGLNTTPLFAAGAGPNTETVSGNTFTFSEDLIPNTTYRWFVRLNCDTDGFSTWAGPYTFTTALACPTPTAGTSTGITAYAATLGWTSPGDTFEVNWGLNTTPVFAAGAGPNTETVSGNTFTFSEDLTPNTTYRWFVRRNCTATEEGYSPWAGPYTFTTPLACPTPTAGTSTGITPNAATLGWTSTGDTFEINWGLNTTPVFAAGDGPNTETEVSGNSFSFADNLTPNTTYRWFVRRDCTATDEGYSPWAGPYTFTTPAIAPAPYSQGFATTTLPVGWTATSYALAAADANIGATPASPKFGDGETNILRRNAWSSSSTGNFTVISVGEIEEGHELKFDYKLVNYAADNAAPPAGSSTIKVEVSTDYGATYSLLETILYDGAEGWQQKVYQLDDYDYLGDYIKVRISDTWTSGSGTDYYIGFDNIYIGAPQTCASQTGLIVSNVSAYGADFSWDDMSAEGDVSYEYAITTSATPPATGTEINSTYVIIEDDLDPQTTYYLHVRLKCDVGSFGTWATSAPFTTLCAAYTTLPHLEEFTTFPPACWLRGTNGDLTTGPATFGTSLWVADGRGNVGSTGATRVNLDVAGGIEWLLSPSFVIPSAGYELRFDVSVHQWNSTGAPTTPWSPDDIVQVLVSTGTTNWTVLYVFDADNVPSTTPTLINPIDLSAYANQTVRFALRVVEGEDNGRDIEFIVDNFEIRETPPCPDQSGLVVTNVTATGAELSWDDKDVDGYEYAVTTSATPPASGTQTTTTFSTPNDLDPLTTYYLHVRTFCGDDGYGVWATSASFKTLCLPPDVTGTTPAEVCGQGEVELAATASAGASIGWYANQTGGTILAEGETFTTPLINETTSYWVSAFVGTSGTGGRTAPTYTSGSYTTAINYGLVFNAADAFTINTVDVYLVGSAGSLVVNLTDTSGSVLAARTIAIPALGSTTTPVVYPITLDIDVPSAGTYRLLAVSSPNMVREGSGATFPYALGDVASITGGYIGGASTTYYYFYNWTFTAGCYSPRTEVVATVDNAPELTLSASSAEICSGVDSELVTVTSNVVDYDTYVWVPSTGVSGNETTGWTFNPSETTTYTLTATQESGSECAKSITFDVVVNEVPSDIEDTTFEVCENEVVELSVTGGTISTEGIIGTGTTFTEMAGIAPSAFNNRYEISKVQTIYTASELQQAGFSVGKIGSIAYNVNSDGSALNNTNYTVKIGHYGSQSTFTTAAFVDDSSFTTCFGPTEYVRQAGVFGWYVIEFDNDFVWDGESNIIIQISMDGADSTNNAITQFTSVPGSILSAVSTTQTMGVPTIRAEKFNIKMVAQAQPEMSWSPATNLYTDSAATTPYVSGDATSVVYFKGSTAGNQDYTVTSTTAAGCENSGTITVTVNETPDAPVATSPQELNEGQTLADLAVTATGDLTWYADAALTIEVPSTTVAVDQTTYYVTQTVGSCTSEATAITVEVTLGRGEFDNVMFKVYPNPTKNILFVSCNQEVSTVEVYNMIGQKVTNVILNANEGQVDMSNLASGAYFVKVAADNATKTIKVIKE